MPRKAKDKDEVIEKKAKVKTAVKKAPAKKTVSKKAADKKSSAKKPVKKKTTTSKKTTTKKATTKKVTTKKTTITKKTATKKTSTKKKVNKRITKAVESKEINKEIKVEEYYDLPYRYDETKVKILAQSPNILFVYWDISDDDRKKYVEKYGDFFFNDTKPVLVVYNDTMKYSFEVDINDFANSWYLHVNDSNCDYRIELGRRPINEYAKIDDYMYISSSNKMDSPNDRILFDSLSNNVYFKNVRTNEVNKKDISLFFLNRIGKLYNVRDFYKTMYKDENIDFERLNLKNMPSS